MATAVVSGTAMRRHALAPLRGLALAGIAVAAFVAGVVGMVTAVLAGCGLIFLFLLFGPLYRGSRKLANLARRLAGDWGGVAVAVPYRPPPPPPQPRADGWYEHDKQLYKKPFFPTVARRLAWLSEDPATGRDFLWQITDIVVGGVLGLLPAALVVGGLVTATTPTAWQATTGTAATAVPLGLLAVVAGFAAGPALLRLHALWTRVLLQPVEQSWSHNSGLRQWIRRAVAACWHCCAFVGLSVVALAGVASYAVTLAIGWGWLLQHTVVPVRWLTNLHRKLAARWVGVEIAEPYRPLPRLPEPGPDGRYRWGRALYDSPQSVARMQRYSWALSDPATWRDLAFLVSAPFVSLLVVTPALVFTFGFFGLVWQPVCWLFWGLPIWLLEGTWVTPWFMWDVSALLVPQLSAVPASLSVVAGLAMAAVGMLAAPVMQRLYARWTKLLLAPTKKASLALRVQRLTETRADATDAQAAELRRIERDLHDGAQARLVAMGMTLGAIETLLDKDPAAARALLAETREASAKALAELRDLVRGIHPPVLAERGLADAVRALALDTPLPVDVTSDLADRITAPVEAAAYFAVTELLTNVAKHAAAKQVRIDIRRSGDILRITVADDGRGGADPERGSGLRGVRRRLGTFDGTLTISSPPGGPTTMTLELPCASSSPRTSTSSEKA